MTAEERLIAATRRAGTRTLLITVGGGALVVFIYLTLIIPAPKGTPSGRAIIFNTPFFVAYMALAMTFGRKVGQRFFARRVRWLAEGRSPTREEQRATLRIPFDQLVVPGAGWGGAAVLFGLINLRYSAELAGRVGVTIFMGGLTCCALFYLLGERGLRDIAARALADGPPLRPIAPGVVARSLIAWALATGVPVAGIIWTAVGIINGDTRGDATTAWSIIFLATAALAIGATATVMAARSIAEPIGSVRAALARVEQGDIDVDVPVYDASEVGLLQAGFNQMAIGLRERERLRDLFGMHVGEDVARQALESGIDLGGELRDAAVLFVDIVGSTRLASDTAPERVVEMLNRFFGIVVEVAEQHGGWVNKFEGDAALCVFGVPTADEACATNALAAGRNLCERLEREDLPAAGIGVSAGKVVAGNIGAAHRLEYTVIGDPVNEAARLTELSKSEQPRVLASERALAEAEDGEVDHWQLGDAVELRGRPGRTRLARLV